MSVKALMALLGLEIAQLINTDFGKLTMSDTDLGLIDMDPQEPFDFFLNITRND